MCDFAEEAIIAIEQRAENEGKRAAYLDAVAKSKYNYDMLIRNQEQTSLNQQYLKSKLLYQSYSFKFLCKSYFQTYSQSCPYTKCHTGDRA